MTQLEHVLAVSDGKSWRAVAVSAPMFLSVFDLYKIGIGPSSSHTVGPMVAARRFLDSLAGVFIPDGARLHVSLHGSLAFTGKGHGTDRAVILGLAGETPQAINPDQVDSILARMGGQKRVTLPDGRTLAFDPGTDLAFDFGPALKGHANGMIMHVEAGGMTVAIETYYSIGGGFVQTDAERNASVAKADTPPANVPYPFSNAAEMLAMGQASGKTIAEMKRANEAVVHGQSLDGKLDHVWSVMNGCMQRGLSQQGILPGGLKVKRRAAEVLAKLRAEQGGNAVQPHRVMDFLSVYAMAVNEENAAGGKVVTAPTNGAAGVIPAVIRYYLDHSIGADGGGIHTFLLASAAVGGIIKHNASISGAEVGCQGEVGSASALAAAGL